MLNLEELRKVEMIVTHENCPDGMASAMILRDVLPKARIAFLQYGMEGYANLPVVPHMLFCDISPPRGRAHLFVEAEAIVLDHHKTAKDVVELFGDRGVFADEKERPGVSGAVLAYEEVWLPLMPPGVMKGDLSPLNPVGRFARLAGIRDTWQKNDPEWPVACSQANALLFYPVEHWMSNRVSYLTENEMAIGRIVGQKRESTLAKVCERVFAWTYRDVRIAILSIGNLVSDAAEVLRNEFDLILSFSYTIDPIHKQPKLLVSCRSGETDFDVGKLAQHFKGGGHTKAAGFEIDVFETSPNPYTTIQERLRQYLDA